MPQSLLSFLWICLIRLGDKCCSQTIHKNTEINECLKALQHPGRTIIYTVNGIKIKTDFIFFYNSLLDKLSGCDGFEMEKGWGWKAVQPVKCLLHKNEGLSSGPQQSTELGIMVLINKHSNGVDRGKKTPGTHRWLPRTHGHTLAYAWACVQAHAPKTWGKGRHFATWCFGRPRIRWLQRTLVHPFLFACLPSFFVLFLLFTASCNFSNSVDCCSASDCHLQLEQCLPWEAPLVSWEFRKLQHLGIYETLRTSPLSDRSSLYSREEPGSLGSAVAAQVKCFEFLPVGSHFRGRWHYREKASQYKYVSQIMRWITG